MELRLANLRSDYVYLVMNLLRAGRKITCRGLATRELTNVTLVVEDTLAPLLPVGVGRGVNLRFAAVEALSLIGGVARPDLLARAAPGYDRVLVDTRDRDYGAYGPRVREQLHPVVRLLDRDPTTRQAVITIWTERDLNHVGDKPCTLTLQFLLRDGALELHTAMRSQDVWLGVPYDVFMFTQLQHTVARELRVPAGRYVHRVGSLHLYETNAADVERLRWPDPAAPVDDLPLGVVTCDPLAFTTGFDVARWLLDREPTPACEVTANGWYVTQLERLDELASA